MIGYVSDFFSDRNYRKESLIDFVNMLIVTHGYKTVAAGRP